MTDDISTAGNSTPFSETISSGLNPGTKYYYKAYVVEYNQSTSSDEYRYGSELFFTTKKVATATVTTSDATSITSSSAQLNASFSGATGTIYKHGFRYKAGTDDWTEVELDSTTGTSGSFSTTISSLSANTLYQFQAYVGEWNENTGAVEYIYSATTRTFTTLQQQSQPTTTGWLELPTASTGSGFVESRFGTGKSRNYSYHYDTNYYTSLWVAYPLTASHITGSASTKTWNYNPDVANNLQINVKSSSYGTNYGNDTYSRGHQIPAADRKCDDTMRGQTYYLTNQTPQDQNGFNSPMWSNLEDAVRGLTSSTDTVYVVTGAAFRKIGENKTINTLTATSSSILPSTIYIPNYYWKAILIVNRSGNTIVSAKTVGVWMEHDSYSSATAWKSHIVSVNDIETWTGFDLFHNLPDNLEETAESNSNWNTFTSNISSVGSLNWGSL